MRSGVNYWLGTLKQKAYNTGELTRATYVCICVCIQARTHVCMHVCLCVCVILSLILCSYEIGSLSLE